MASKITNKILLSKVKEYGIVNIINEYIPDKYLVITETENNRPFFCPLVGQILFEDEVENMFKIKISNKIQIEKLKHLHTYIQKVKPYKKYEFIISDIDHSQIKFIEFESAIEKPNFQIKCDLDGFFRKNTSIVCQQYARPCGFCLDRGTDYGFYHIDELIPYEFYEYLCEECYHELEFSI